MYYLGSRKVETSVSPKVVDNGTWYLSWLGLALDNKLNSILAWEDEKREVKEKENHFRLDHICKTITKRGNQYGFSRVNHEMGFGFTYQYEKGLDCGIPWIGYDNHVTLANIIITAVLLDRGQKGFGFLLLKLRIGYWLTLNKSRRHADSSALAVPACSACGTLWTIECLVSPPAHII